MTVRRRSSAQHQPAQTPTITNWSFLSRGTQYPKRHLESSLNEGVVNHPQQLHWPLDFNIDEKALQPFQTAIHFASQCLLQKSSFSNQASSGAFMLGAVVGILSVGRYTKLTLKVSEHGFEDWCEHWPVKNNDDKKKIIFHFVKCVQRYSNR